MFDLMDLMGDRKCDTYFSDLSSFNNRKTFYKAE